MYSKILATGAYIPEGRLTNADLEQLVETSDEWITTRTGIKQRPIMGQEQTVSQMATEAALAAIAQLQSKNPDFDVQDIDAIICATSTSEYLFPSCAMKVMGNLGIKSAIGFDVAAACSGFVYALNIADKFIKDGSCKHVLVIGADALSKTIDPTDRGTIILFGDAAGAMLLGPSDKAGIIGSILHGSPASQNALTLENAKFGDGKGQLQMAGNSVFKIAVYELANIVTETLEKFALKESDIDWLVPHQANLRIIKATAQKLNLPLERVILTIADHGNTSAASIPTAFDQAVREGKFKAGEKILLEAFGGGMVWGSVLVEWQD